MNEAPPPDCVHLPPAERGGGREGGFGAAIFLLTTPLVSCDAPPSSAGGSPQLAEFVGEPGTLIQFAPADTPSDPPLSLLIAADSWEARQGADWELAEPVASWRVEIGDSLVVDGEALLGPKLGTPKETEVWYGTWSETLAGSGAGEFEGEQVFAQGLGPIVLTLDSTRRECVYYERDFAASGGDTGDTAE